MVAPRIAIIGSGPAGLYTCGRLLQKLSKCHVDVFDRNPVPYGLVYYGVAPDHFDMKKCTNQFEKMFNDYSTRLSLFCNVNVGVDLKYDELCKKYEAVVLAYGANKARTLNIKNDSAFNCISGSDFVSWYNGQPKSSATPLLDAENAVIIGNGNVAIDCSRILLSPPEKFVHTDLPEYALKALRNSNVCNIKILGRRGPKEASFSIKELRELLNLEGCSTFCNIPADVLSEIKKTIMNADRPKKRLLELMCSYIKPKNSIFESKKKCTIEFYTTLDQIFIDKKGRVCEIQVKNIGTANNCIYKIPCSLLIYALGFENILLPGLPRTKDNRLQMLDWCRVPDINAKVYATGWCSHAAQGFIADSQRQAITVADELVDDWNCGKINHKNEKCNIEELLAERNVEYVSWSDWKYIDECERRMGALLSKPREKINDMIRLLKIRNTF